MTQHTPFHAAIEPRAFEHTHKKPCNCATCTSIMTTMYQYISAMADRDCTCSKEEIEPPYKCDSCDAQTILDKIDESMK